MSFAGDWFTPRADSITVRIAEEAFNGVIEALLRDLAACTEALSTRVRPAIDFARSLAITTSAVSLVSPPIQAFIVANRLFHP